VVVYSTCSGRGCRLQTHGGVTALLGLAGVVKTSAHSHASTRPAASIVYTGSPLPLTLNWQNSIIVTWTLLLGC
jgi:hypothetical protein